MEIKRKPKPKPNSLGPSIKWRNLYVHRNGRGYPGTDLFYTAEQAKFWADNWVNSARIEGYGAFHLESGPDRPLCADTDRPGPGIFLNNFLFHIQVPE